MRPKVLTIAVVATIVASLLGVTGCQKETITTPAPTPTPTAVPKVTTLVVQGTRDALQPITCGICRTDDVILAVPFTTSATGVLSTVVNWTYPANTIYVGIAVGTNSCVHAGTYDGKCDFLQMYQSDDVNKPLSLVAAGSVPARDYTMYVENGGPGNEWLSYQVFVTYD